MNAKKNIVIGVIYRIPNTNMMDFNTTLASVLEQLRMENKLVYLMGDYNIDLFNSETHDLTNAFVDVMYCNEFLPLISRPTRITNSSATLINNIFTNNHDNLNCSLSGILVADVSDHFPVFHINWSFTVEETESFIVTQVFNEKNKQKFREAISAVDIWLKSATFLTPRIHLVIFFQCWFLYRTSAFLKLEYERNTRIENLGFRMVYVIQAEIKINYITNTKRSHLLKMSHLTSLSRINWITCWKLLKRNIIEILSYTIKIIQENLGLLLKASSINTESQISSANSN